MLKKHFIGDSMISRRNLFFSLLVLTIILFASFGLSQTPGSNKKPSDEVLTPSVNPASIYKESCGQCHMPYPSDFLPSGSWEKLMTSTENHFGTPLDLNLQTKNILVEYLTKNGAENSKNRTADKIMASLDGQTPLRITEVPYILKKHRKATPEILQRKSIGSLANCNACHRLAMNGTFNRKIVIPD
jgi:hypothetical protein